MYEPGDESHFAQLCRRGNGVDRCFLQISSLAKADELEVADGRTITLVLRDDPARPSSTRGPAVWGPKPARGSDVPAFGGTMG